MHFVAHVMFINGQQDKQQTNVFGALPGGPIFIYSKQLFTK